MTRFSLALALTVGLGVMACKSKPVSESEARSLASKALARYCMAEKLSPQYFNLTRIGPSGDFPWMVVYVSSGIKPAQEVAVIIDKRGSVELSVDVEGVHPD